jgi:hypothetical protein
MKEPNGRNGYIMICIVLILALVTLWLLLPYPKGKNTRPPSLLGDQGSREHIHHTKEEGETNFSHLINELKKRG